MNYVNNLNINGTDIKEIPCIKGSGLPSLNIPFAEWAIGLLYINTDNGDLYRCIDVAGALRWSLVTREDFIIDATLNDDETEITYSSPSFDQIDKAYNEGRRLFLEINGVLYPHVSTAGQTVQNNRIYTFCGHYGDCNVGYFSLSQSNGWTVKITKVLREDLSGVNPINFGKKLGNYLTYIPDDKFLAKLNKVLPNGDEVSYPNE